MVGSKLKILRQQYNMTQRQLAHKLGISTSAVGMYEQGRREPDHEMLLSLCKLFRISVDYLLRQEVPGESKEFSDIINGFERTLLGQEGLMLNGVLLRKDDVKKIVDAIRIGVELAVKSNAK
ncbi:MAG: helix-turn-helix transcriptional regulator [Oscillospiraceae bacterium]|nr:helix-turn-helix transcriptional regulator [Oscillospiraceae bacterium]